MRQHYDALDEVQIAYVPLAGGIATPFELPAAIVKNTDNLIAIYVSAIGR